MITEFAEIEVKRGCEAQFVEGVKACEAVFARAPGCHGIELHQSIESPEHFVLLVKWDSVADHMEKFRNSEDFNVWRAAVGASFAGAPKVWHSETLI